MAHRWQVARLLEQGLPYLEIAERTGASTTTVTRVAHWLRHGEGGYRLRSTARPPESRRCRSKGRLREPSFHLLEDAGLGPEQPGDRALAFPCRNAPVEVLLVRAADIPEYVQDGVVDCGITGIDLVRERGAEVHELLTLGFGSCRLEAAVPAESASQCVRRPRRAVGRDRLPAADARAAAGRRDARRRDRLGRDRAAARPRRRDRRPRLVGEHAAHERPALARRAARVGGRARRARRRGGGAVRGDAARGRRGAPPPLPDAERAGERRCPRSRELVAPRIPSVLPLAEAGMVAVHALVPVRRRLAAAARARGGRRARRS